MNKLKRKYYTFRVNRIVNRLYKRANKAHLADGKKFHHPLYRNRVPQFLSAEDTKTWLLAIKAKWMLDHNAPNEHDITGLDFNPKDGDLTALPIDRKPDVAAAYATQSQEPSIIVTFDERGRPLYNGERKHPVYGEPLTAQEKITIEEEHGKRSQD